MRTDTSCTLYRKQNGGYIRIRVLECHWQERKAANVLKSGQQNADSITVYIPASAMILFPGNAIVPATDLFPMIDTTHQKAAEDIIVKGECLYEFDNTSEKTVSDSLKELRNSYEFHTIMSVDRLFYGPLPLQHVKISAR